MPYPFELEEAGVLARSPTPDARQQQLGAYPPARPPHNLQMVPEMQAPEVWHQQGELLVSPRNEKYLMLGPVYQCDGDMTPYSRSRTDSPTEWLDATAGAKRFYQGQSQAAAVAMAPRKHTSRLSSHHHTARPPRLTPLAFDFNGSSPSNWVAQAFSPAYSPYGQVTEMWNVGNVSPQC